ncbi:MAG: hypothetical protein ACLTJ5_01405 [Clostridium sp.]
MWKKRQKLEEIANKLFGIPKLLLVEDEMEIVNQLTEEENVTAIVGQISEEDSVDKLLQNHILQEDASIIILDEKECDLPAISLEEYPSVRTCNSLVYNEKSLGYHK